MSYKNIELYFGEDHDRLDEYFKQFQLYKDSDFRKARESFKMFKLSLQRHIAWEEDVLFPVFEQKTGLHDTGPTAVMRLEHRQVERALEEIHKKVQRSDRSSDRDEAPLLQLLKRHSDKEENIVYPMLDEMTTREERNEMYAKMRNMPESRYKNCCGIHSHN